MKQKAKTISKAQRLQLIGLRAVSEQLDKQLESLRAAAVAITGEKDSNDEPELTGHTFDYLNGYREIGEMLRLVNVRVKP